MTSKVSVVTGGAQGIGKAIAGALLKDGYKVGIFDIGEEKGKETASGYCAQFGSDCCVFFNCDVTNTEQLKECYEQVEKRLGGVSVVVNNAAFFDETNMKKLLEVNLAAVIELTYLAVEKMRKDKGGKGGSVVNIASGAGLVTLAGKTGYVASKWGVIGFTKSMAASLSLAEEDWGISVGALCPTLTETENVRLARQIIGKGAQPPTTERNGLSPAVPQDACSKYFTNVMQSPASSLDELADAFMTLLKDNKNGAVMRLLKEEGSPQIAQYVEQNWGEV